MDTPADLSRPRIKRDKVTLLLFAVSGMFGYGIGLLSPLIAQARKDMDFSFAVSGMHSSFWALGTLLIGFIGPSIVTKLGRKNTRILAMVTTSIAITAFCLDFSLIFTFGGAFLFGSVGTFLITTALASLSEKHPENQVSINAEANAVGALMAAFAPIFFGLMVDSPLGWRAVAIPPVALTLYLLISLKESDRPLHVSKTESKKLAQKLPKEYWIVCALLFCQAGVEFTVALWATEYFKTRFESTTSQAATFLGVYYFAIFVARWIGSPLGQRFKSMHVVLGCMTLISLGFSLYWLTDNTAVAVAGLAIMGLGTGNLYPFVSTLSIKAAGPGLVDAAITRLAIPVGVAVLAIPLLLGSLADSFGVHTAYLVVLAFIAAAIPLCVIAHLAVDRASQPTKVTVPDSLAPEGI